MGVTRLDEVSSGRAACNRIWVTSYRRTRDAIEVDRRMEATLSKTHRKVADRQFVWVSVALYVPNG